MIFSNKQINLILFISLVVLIIACIYLGYTSINEGFNTSTMANSIAPSSTSAAIGTGVSSSSISSSSLTVGATNPITTNAMTTNTITTNAMTTNPITTNTITTNPMTINPMTTNAMTTNAMTTNPMTTNPMTTNAMTTNAITTKPKLMNNGFKIPQTNLLQNNFNGSSNIYSPYLYIQEPFQSNSYDMDNYQYIL